MRARLDTLRSDRLSESAAEYLVNNLKVLDVKYLALPVAGRMAKVPR